MIRFTVVWAVTFVVLAIRRIMTESRRPLAVMCRNVTYYKTVKSGRTHARAWLSAWSRPVASATVPAMVTATGLAVLVTIIS